MSFALGHEARKWESGFNQIPIRTFYSVVEGITEYLYQLPCYICRESKTEM